MSGTANGKLASLRRLMNHIGEQAATTPGARSALMRRALHLYRKRRFSISEMIENGLLDPALSDQELTRYASRDEQIAFITRNVPSTYYALTADQSIAIAACRLAGLPTPELIALYDHPRGFAPGGPSLADASSWVTYLNQALPHQFFIKPAVGMLGQGTGAYRRDGDGVVDEVTGERLSIAAFHRHLSALADALAREHRGYGASLGLTRPAAKILIQKRLFSHPDIVSLTGSEGLSCLRIITFIDADHELTIIGTAMKLIAGKGITDNYHKGQTGNIWASVDSASGRLLRAHGPVGGNGSYQKITDHPQTGYPIEGFVVPLWEEVRENAMRAARAFMPHPLIGWDIAVTPEGPVIIEGNSRWTILPAPLNVRLNDLVVRPKHLHPRAAYGVSKCFGRKNH